MNFIKVSLERNRFSKLFEAEDLEMMRLVDQLFETIFQEKFDMAGEDEIMTVEY